MRRSKHVQSAWILVILINLTHFFVYFLLFLKKIFKKPFVYKYFFEKRKKHSHWFLLVVRLWRSRICLIFDENFRILWQILFLKSVFIFFHKKYILIALHFWQNHQILTKFSVFFQKLRKSCCLGENRKLSVFLFWEIRQIHGFWAFQTAEICHRFPQFPFSIQHYVFLLLIPLWYSVF